MKLGILIASLILVTGCAANPALQSQVDQLQKETARQDAEIKDLSAKAAKCNAGLVTNDLKQDASDLASAAWSWLTEQAGDAKRASSQIITCYRQGSDSVHTLEEGQALMAYCYRQQHQQ